MEATTHPHKPLRLNSREIRIISLSPGFWDEDITCTTQVVSLDSAPAFSALSYTWGAPTLTDYIFLDGERFPIMNNLGAALRHLRQQIEVRILWIDFLSIDQRNNDEKSWQVNMMGDIYKACERVYLWLGEESEESDKWCENEDYQTCMGDHRGLYSTADHPSLAQLHLPDSNDRLSPVPPHTCGRPRSRDAMASPYAFVQARRRQKDGESPDPCLWHGRQPRISEAFTLIKMLAEDCHVNAIPGFVNLTSSVNADQRRFVEPIQALNAMMRRSWWYRIWTVQEAVLPKNGIIMCGPLEMSWATMTKAAMNWHRHSNTCCSVLKDRIYGALNYPTHGEPTYLTLSTFYRSLMALNNIKFARGNQEPGEWDFMPLFHLFSNRHAGDLRDKVYGLLGMLEPDHRPVQADYGIHMADLNRKLSRQLLLSGQLSVLYNPAGNSEQGTVASWTKDFGHTVKRVEQRIEDFRNSNRQDYSATGSESAHVRVCSKTTLSLSALWIDQVEAVSRVFGVSESEADIAAYLRECAGLVNFSTRKNSTYRGGGTVKEAFLRTALGDRCRSAEIQTGVRRPKEAELQRLKEWVFELDVLPPHTRSHLGNNIKYNICDRVFFLTARGSMGFGPENMRAGDEVWVLLGAKVPVVLRPLRSTISREEDSGILKPQPGYTARRHRAVVGDCYLHGIMEGEALVERHEMTVVLR